MPDLITALNFQEITYLLEFKDALSVKQKITISYKFFVMTYPYMITRWKHLDQHLVSVVSVEVHSDVNGMFRCFSTWNSMGFSSYFSGYLKLKQHKYLESRATLVSIQFIMFRI